ncbi:hypothetical protein HAX54_016747, partial [Datura stramonium]|nr:hypothetical protein [Datura stramonium]
MEGGGRSVSRKDNRRDGDVWMMVVEGGGTAYLLLVCRRRNERGDCSLAEMA